MSMNYKLINSTNVDCVATVDIMETATNQVIRYALPYSKAKDFCRNLNFGGGFDGYTPEFFLKNI